MALERRCLDVTRRIRLAEGRLYLRYCRDTATALPPDDAT